MDVAGGVQADSAMECQGRVDPTAGKIRNSPNKTKKISLYTLIPLIFTNDLTMHTWEIPPGNEGTL